VKVLLSVQPQAPKRKVRFIIQRPSEDAKRRRGGVVLASKEQTGSKAAAEKIQGTRTKARWLRLVVI